MGVVWGVWRILADLTQRVVGRSGSSGFEEAIDGHFEELERRCVIIIETYGTKRRR